MRLNVESDPPIAGGIVGAGGELNWPAATRPGNVLHVESQVVEIQDNLAAVELTLSQDELRQLDEVSALAPEYPGWMLPFQGADRLEPVDRWGRFREASKPH